MFVVVLEYLKPLSEVDQFLDAHVRYLDEQYAAGNFLASGRRVPRTGGVILCRAESLDALEEILRQDPFNRHGIAKYEVIEFIPSKTAPQLAALAQILS